MNRALFKLMKLQARAGLRRSLRGVRTARGAAFFAIGLGVFLLWLGPTLISAVTMPRGGVDPETVREFLPAGLLLACAGALLGSGDKALAFTPAEVNFLFPGPFSRRSLLGYKTAKAAVGAATVGLLMSFAMRRFAQLWVGAFVGAFLSLMLVHLFTVCVVLIGQTVSAGAYTRGRRVALAVIVGVVALSLGPALASGTTADVTTLVHQFALSTPGRILLAPFYPFARTLTAGSVFPELVLWALAAAGVNALLLALTMWLDANYLEAAEGASRRVYERVQRLRQGLPGVTFGAGESGENGNGGTGAAAGASAKRWGGALARRVHVPRLPWLGGAGPVAWRQLSTAARRSGGVLFLLVISAGIFATFFVVGRRGADMRGAVFSTMGWFTLLLLANLKFDFRGELDQMPWLKSLPLRPLSVAAGEMATPVLLLCAAHLVMFGAAAVALPPMRATLLMAAVLAPPLDLLLVGVENLLFLLFPSRGAAISGELGAMGRQVVLIVAKLLVVVFACGVATGLAVAAMALTHSALLAIGVAFAALAVQAISLVPLVALAYRRFDPSTDTPP
jgi:hypothetical protein